MAKLLKVKTVIPTKIRRSHTQVDACFLWCIDPRFRSALWKVEKKLRIRRNHVDIIKTPGGAKALTSESREKREILRQITISISLHQPKVLIPMLHFDCGAYKPLDLKKDDEEKFLIKELTRALSALSSFRIPVKPIVVDFDKILIFDC